MFSEDPERWTILRETKAYADLCDAAREQCARSGGSVSPGSLSPAALRAAMEGLIMSGGAPAGLQWLQETGALRTFLPELDATVNFSQEAGRRHKDVWEHTKQVVWQAEPRPAVRWAALLHDIGKVKTRRIEPNGEVHFFGHAEVGAAMFDRLQTRTQLFVGGDSAGGNLAAVVAINARSEGPKLAGQVLIYPATDFSMSHPSHSEPETSVLLTHSVIRWFSNHYLNGADGISDWRASPSRRCSFNCCWCGLF